MKYSLTASRGALPALFDHLAAGLAGGASGRLPAPDAREPRRSLFDRFEQAVWRSRQAEVERYLAGSADLADLEDRIRRLERRSLSQAT